MNNFSNLQKLLVIVPVAQCNNFRTLHITGATSTDSYWNKIAFLEDTNEIYTHGKVYGCSGDISDVKAILSGYGSEGRYATVQEEIDAIIASLDSSNIINVSYTQGTGYTVEDNISLSYNSGYVYIGGGTSYGTQLGNGLAIADTGDDIADTGYTYIGVTSAAAREYVSTYVSAQLGDLTTSGTVTATGVTTGDDNLQFSYSETNGIVTIDNFTYKVAYVSVADNLVAYLDRDGLVTGELLSNVINALNPWEEYTEVQPVGE